ncbi:MAG: lysoplasmalogenase family protein [Jatrophihabitantaceae bacterium]
MTAAGWVWVAVAGVLAVLDWAAVAAGSRLLERCAKPAVLLALLAAALTAQPRHSEVHGWLILALCFGLIGDVALSFAPPGQPAGQLTSTAAASTAAASPAEALQPVSTGQQPPAIEEPVKAAPAAPSGGAHRARPPAGAELRAGAGQQPPSALFTAGLASFLLGHLCYCAAMLNYGTDQLSLGFGLVLVLLALLAFGHRVLAGAQKQGGNALTIAVAAYMTTLGSTVVLGIGTTSLWVAYGIVAFAFSDLVLATDRFVARRGWAPLTVAISYHFAQTLLLLGLVH